MEGEQKGLKSFINTTQCQDAHPSYGHVGTLLKYGSDIHLEKPKHMEREQSLGFMRTKTLPVSSGRISTQSHIKMPYHKGRPLSKSDERQCLADALQWHVEELIDGIVFKDSELPDDLLGDSCLTDEECSCLRQTLDRKSQVRVLISIIKGRDFNVLVRFLKHIKTQNKSVGRSIEEKFEQNKINGVRCSECALCNLTSNVNLKYISDRLWMHKLIEDGVFNWIVQSDRPTGLQGELWRAVINSLNIHCRKHGLDVIRILSTALTKNNHYDHVAKGLERMISTNGELSCHCELRQNVIQPAESFLSLQSSRYPRSSEFDTDSKSEVVTSQIENLSVKRIECENITGIKQEQDLKEPETLISDTKQKRSQSQITKEDDTAQTIETGEISPRVMSPSDFDQAGDRVYTTTSSDETKVHFISKNSIIFKECAKSMISQKDENTNDFLGMSKMISEENDDTTRLQNSSSKDTSNSKTRLRNENGETNVSMGKDKNSKHAVPETLNRVFHARHIILIPDNELEESYV